jgi:hypothetical protein
MTLIALRNYIADIGYFMGLYLLTLIAFWDYTISRDYTI